MNTSETPRGLSDRGIGWQAAGFTLVALVSISILEIFSGSDFWLYKAFRTAVVQIYWAFVVPLGALFDWGRRMFETGKAIREAKLKQIRDEGLHEGRRDRRGVRKDDRRPSNSSGRCWRSQKCPCLRMLPRVYTTSRIVTAHNRVGPQYQHHVQRYIVRRRYKKSSRSGRS